MTVQYRGAPDHGLWSCERKHAMRWLDWLDELSGKELKDSVVPNPNSFSGNKYATEISEVRITGAAEFIEAVAAFLETASGLRE